MSNSRIFCAVTAGVFFVAGMGILAYSGPGALFLRGTMGDVLVVPFLYFLWAAARPTPWHIRAIGTYSLAAAIEFFQLLELVDADSHILLQLTLGTTFDPWDFVAYAVGLGIGVGIEWTWHRTRRP